jgi:N-acetyl-D-muramate 6-phosphate phosphatase
MKLKAILFDLDGTLLDTAPEFTDGINQLRLEERLPPLSLGKIRPAISHGSTEVVKIAFNLTQSHPDIEILKQRFLKIYQTNLGGNTHYFPGIEALLSTIEQLDLKWGIVTNKPHYLTYPLLAKFQLTDRAHCIVSGDTLAVAKPHPEPILHACKQMNVRPQDCYYVGDAQRDIAAGKAAGILATFMALYGYLSPKDNPYDWGASHYIQHPKEILIPIFSMG